MRIIFPTSSGEKWISHCPRIPRYLYIRIFLSCLFWILKIFYLSSLPGHKAEKRLQPGISYFDISINVIILNRFLDSLTNWNFIKRLSSSKHPNLYFIQSYHSKCFYLKGRSKDVSSNFPDHIFPDTYYTP